MKKQKRNLKNKLIEISRWFIMTFAGIALYIVASRQAFHQRGYEAIGGEIFILFLPLIYFPIEHLANELFKEFKNEFKTEGRHDRTY